MALSKIMLDTYSQMNESDRLAMTAAPVVLPSMYTDVTDRNRQRYERAVLLNVWTLREFMGLYGCCRYLTSCCFVARSLLWHSGNNCTRSSLCNILVSLNARLFSMVVKKWHHEQWRQLHPPFCSTTQLASDCYIVPPTLGLVQCKKIVQNFWEPVLCM